MSPNIAGNTTGYIQGIGALLSVGFAGASAFTGSIALMLLAVLTGGVASFIAVHTVRSRTDPSN